MKNKTYRYGKLTFRAYFKPVGQGFEAGLIHDGKPVFLGNFIHSAEANRWWTKMNAELRTFVRRFKAADTVSKAWYCKFISAHLYTCYYAFLDKHVTQHERNFERQYKGHVRKYNGMKRNWTPKNYFPRLKVG